MDLTRSGRPAPLPGLAIGAPERLPESASLTGARRLRHSRRQMAKSVYRDYDQHALDAEYNNREKVKESADWLSRYAVASAEARAALDCRLDLAYGAHPGERLDVFPARGGPAPVHVFIHGGYWHRLDKSDSSFGAPPEPGALPARALGTAPARRRRARGARVSPPGRGNGRGLAHPAPALPGPRHARPRPLFDPRRARRPEHHVEPPAAAPDGLPLRRRIRCEWPTSCRSSAAGSTRPSPKPPAPSVRAGRRSPPVAIRSSSRRPAPARPWRRSCGRSTLHVASG